MGGGGIHSGHEDNDDHGGDCRRISLTALYARCVRDTCEWVKQDELSSRGFLNYGARFVISDDE